VGDGWARQECDHCHFGHEVCEAGQDGTHSSESWAFFFLIREEDFFGGLRGAHILDHWAGFLACSQNSERIPFGESFGSDCDYWLMSRFSAPTE
jgi:hypothetical protein